MAIFNGQNLGYGTAGQVLLSNGPDALPTFQNQPYVAQTITNGVTTSAPSQDAVFDALALKATVASGVKIAYGSLTPSGSADSVSFGVTFSAPPVVVFGYERNSAPNKAFVTAENGSITTTGMSVRAWDENGSGATNGTIFWLAIGT